LSSSWQAFCHSSFCCLNKYIISLYIYLQMFLEALFSLFITLDNKNNISGLSLSWTIFRIFNSSWSILPDSMEYWKIGLKILLLSVFVEVLCSLSSTVLLQFLTWLICLSMSTGFWAPPYMFLGHLTGFFTGCGLSVHLGTGKVLCCSTVL